MRVEGMAFMPNGNRPRQEHQQGSTASLLAVARLLAKQAVADHVMVGTIHAPPSTHAALSEEEHDEHAPKGT
jgi:phage FluMu gp28-like protein